MTSHRPLDGKIALITGASRGLGAATARHLSRWVARVIVTYRQRSDAADEVVAACAAETPGAYAVQMDQTDEQSVRSAFSQVIDAEERLDFLIANAAAMALKPLLALKMHQIDKTFAISVRHWKPRAVSGGRTRPQRRHGRRSPSGIRRHRLHPDDDRAAV